MALVAEIMMMGAGCEGGAGGPLGAAATVLPLITGAPAVVAENERKRR
jgi:hypothetical protein